MQGDPDVPLASWLREGAPAGVDLHPESVGIFPSAHEPPSGEFDLTYYCDESANYVSMDDSDHGDDVLQELVDAGYVDNFMDPDAAQKALGVESIVTSKLALITTMKNGVPKHRLILDCRVSGANAATTKHERVLLPQVWDVIRDSLTLQSGLTQGQEVYYFVCDFKDAFYKLPIHPRERQYFAAVFQGSIYVWRRVGQGSTNGPCLFGRLSAFVGRATQTIIPLSECKSQIFVDDPILTLGTTRARAERLLTMACMLWMVILALASPSTRANSTELSIGSGTA